MSDSGTIDEPVLIIRSDDRSVRAHAGSASAALMRGRHHQQQARALQGDVPEQQLDAIEAWCRVTRGADIEQRQQHDVEAADMEQRQHDQAVVGCVRSCAWIELMQLNSRAFCVSSTPLGSPEVPEV